MRQAGGLPPLLPSSLPPSCTLPLFLPAAAPEPSRDEVDDDAPRLEGGDEGLNPLVVEEQGMEKRVKGTCGSRWKKGSGALSGKAFHSNACSSSV